MSDLQTDIIKKQSDFFRESKKNVIALIFIFCIILLIFWYIKIHTNGLNISLSSIWKIHTDNLELFFIDILPIVLALIFGNLHYRIQAIKSNYEKIIQQKNSVINKNAQLANKFGSGDFAITDLKIYEHDILQKSLLKMRQNLLDNNKKESELNWIARGKEQISNILRIHNNIEALSNETLVTLIKYINVVQGAVYIYDEYTHKLINVATYAYNRRKYINQEFAIGEGLIGQAAFEMGTIYRTEIPDYYVSIKSGIIDDNKPKSILIVPLVSEENLKGVIEFASVEKIPELSIKLIEEVSFIIARTIFNLKINAKTRHLLLESQQKTEELKHNEDVLKQNADEMKATKEMIEVTNIELNIKVQEIENAQKRLHSLLLNASEVISIYNEEGIVKYESPSVEKILGYKAEDIIGKNGFERVESEAQSKIEGIFKDVLIHPWKTPSTEFLYNKPDGNVIWLETTTRNMLKDQAINGVIFNTRDITQNKIAEKEQRMRGQMQSLSENSPDIIIRFGLDGKIFYVNPMMQYYTGIKTKSLLKKQIDSLGLEEQIVSFFKSTIELIKQKNKKVEIEFIFPTIKGTKIMMVNSIPEFNDDNELESILFVAHDITERKQIEIEIQEKNKKITESINYAEHIQVSILPNTKLLQEYIEKSFIFYRPKDVVSGDFPWFFKKNEFIYIAVVDCTGHGVPGAMLSLIGYFLLNNIVDKEKIHSASEILDELHIGVRHTLRQESPDAEARDGMDIALLKINTNNNLLEYSGAHRSLLFLRENTLEEIKADKKAIGGIPLKGKTEKDFTNHTINLLSGDKFFIFSDGLSDQLGGPERKKYSTRRVREVIQEKNDYSIEKLANHLANDFINWQGNNKQIDDVLLIGIQI